eukprot:CAMPEP_0202426862 /NCGR_PEP_ID=MMETSP1345-20130828/1186_1 /ASSEMBLY_ACC=CAM_ASM_000843 /TAXON_ID=342563 /ORGANISM="Fabrea Fabrea salina" /LENGTH=57 /DNA_ID=CAMNT_0049037411 /DNA_START=709 /DNA_END=882 /DNA_ORIENTATION=-
MAKFTTRVEPADTPATLAFSRKKQSLEEEKESTALNIVSLEERKVIMVLPKQVDDID